jgi:hypothetical protein
MFLEKRQNINQSYLAIVNNKKKIIKEPLFYKLK